MTYALFGVASAAFRRVLKRCDLVGSDRDMCIPYVKNNTPWSNTVELPESDGLGELLLFDFLIYTRQ
jgi:hypothetical protein